ncbi:MAG TPA: hypothetical protein VM871_09115 [Flavisolibacter sp.]|jgi:hypothetical protein|nr:hypothetical protein [Flavisolibacter sp.]
MMTKNAPSVIQMGREELATLMASVNETVATDVAYLQSVPKPKNFGALQLWNIRKSARYQGLVIR